MKGKHDGVRELTFGGGGAVDASRRGFVCVFDMFVLLIALNV